MNQLFIITLEACRALSSDEVNATVAGLKEAGLYALPYPTVDVQFAGDAVCHQAYTPAMDKAISQNLLIRVDDMVIGNYGPLHWISYKNISLDHFNYQKFQRMDKGHPLGLAPQAYEISEARFGPRYAPNEKERNAVANTLIVLLATRNAVKTTVHRKAAKLGIGKGVRRYEYTTTISVPQELEADPEHQPTGTTRCPHLRRGHIRRKQHYGPRNSLIREKWIDPIFVNADQEWVRTRKAYNVSIGIPPE